MWIDFCQEQRFVCVNIAQPGDNRLVQKRRFDACSGSSGQSLDQCLSIQGLIQWFWPERGQPSDSVDLARVHQPDAAKTARIMVNQPDNAGAWFFKFHHQMIMLLPCRLLFFIAKLTCHAQMGHQQEIWPKLNEKVLAAAI